MLHDDRWLRLRADDCVTAAGQQIAPYYVLHYTDWVHIVAVTPTQEVVVVRQYRHGVAETLLELPGGMVDQAESPADAARRELEEETGYRVGTVQPILSLPANPATHTNRIHTFLGTDACLAAQARTEAGEDLTVHTLPVPDLVSALRDGRFGQSMQAGGLLLALQTAGLLQIDVENPHGGTCGAP